MNARSVALVLTLTAAGAMARPFTIDDEMKMRSIVDVKIAPDGSRVAYVVSTPNLTKNEHEGALFVVPADGGAPARLAESIHIFNTPAVAPRLRWSPDGTTLALLAVAGGPPQVFAIPLNGDAPRALTEAAGGVSSFEWSPDGKSIAYLTRDVVKPLVIHVDAPDPPSRIVVRRIDGSSTETITPVSHYVESFSWSPDGAQIMYSAGPKAGFSAQYLSRIYAVSSTTAAGGGGPTAIVDRLGMNTRPLWSPDVGGPCAVHCSAGP